MFRKTSLYQTPRGHCYQLPRKTSALDDNSFFYRVLYRRILSSESLLAFNLRLYIFSSFFPLLCLTAFVGFVVE